jgi:hypothetical protein
MGKITDDEDKFSSVLERLLLSAYNDGGGSRRAGQFLLSLWHGAKYKADLQELLYVDKDHFADMQTVLQTLYRLNDQLDTYLTEEEMELVIERWGETFEKK